MLRKILFFGLMTVAGTVFGQNRNTADKVDRPNTNENKLRCQGRVQFLHVYGFRVENQRCDYRRGAE